MMQEQTTYNLHNDEEINAWRIRKLALFAGKVFMLIHVAFIVFQVLGILLIPSTDIVHIRTYWMTIWANVFVVCATLIFWLLNRHQQNKGIKAGRVFRVSMLIVAFAMLFTWLFHLHIGGSLNSLILSLILTGLLVITTFLTTKQAKIFFVVGNLSVFVLVALEYFRVIPYAPLFTQGEKFTEIFLNWRSVLMSAMIYTGLACIVGIITFKTRATMERNSQKLYKTNTKLVNEIEERKRIQKENERLIEELQQALKEVKTLEDLMPICSGCKKIRDDSGYWQQVEGYLEERAGATFTHGLCPDCAQKLYPEFADKDLNNKDRG